MAPTSETPGLVDAHGKPVASDRGVCPGCGAKKEKRVQTAGFGAVRPSVCTECGHEFPAERI